MKRKIKLFGSIAALALAVSLMSVGVFAATTYTATVTNTVTYTATPNVKATITLTSAAAGANTTIDSGLGTPAAHVITAKSDQLDAGTMAIGDVELTATDTQGQIVYSYTITIDNDALATDWFNQLDAVVTIDDVTYAAGGYGIVLSGEFTSEVSLAIAQGDSAYYTVTFTGDANVSHSEIDLGSSIVLTMSHAA